MIRSIGLVKPRDFASWHSWERASLPRFFNRTVLPSDSWIVWSYTAAESDLLFRYVSSVLVNLEGNTLRNRVEIRHRTAETHANCVLSWDKHEATSSLPNLHRATIRLGQEAVVCVLSYCLSTLASSIIIFIIVSASLCLSLVFSTSPSAS
jgi:hypothetical protein